ncbi:TPA: hypothetical protein NKX25_000438 [Vibrio parahaemolyticus]|nr:hypothetical protein [Vibrio parahaemolyticus]
MMKYPKLFSNKIQLAARSQCLPDDFLSEQHCNTISLIKPEIKWLVNGVHVLLELDLKNIENINKWQRKNGEKEYLLEPKSTGEHVINLGYFIPANSKKPWRHMVQRTIKHNTCFFQYGSVSGISLSRGKLYLSIYLKCTNKATEIVKDIPVGHLSSKKIPITINPFSKYYVGFQYSSSERQSEAIIENNLKTLKSEAIAYSNAIFKEINLNKTIGYSSSVSLDLYIKEPFINKDTHETKGYKTIIDDRVKPLCIDFSDRNHELLLPKTPNLLSDEFDYIYIRENDEVRNSNSMSDFSSMPHNAVDSHNIYSFIFLLDKVKMETHKTHSLSLMKRRNLNKKYEKLQKIGMLINEQKKSISSINEHVKNSGFLHYEGNQYKNQFQKLLNKIEERTKNFELEIILEKNITNEIIQAENLQYHKKYSKYVFVLIIVQIIIGVLTVNWAESWNSIKEQFNALIFLF